MRHGQGLHERRKTTAGLGTYGAVRSGGQAVALVIALACAVWLAGSAAAGAEPTRIVAFGDSLTAGYELPPDQAFPVKLEAALKEKGYDVVVMNAGVSGDTASAGLERLDWAVPEDADGVIVELGANDALRGIDPARTREALTAVVERLEGRGIEVLLAGMYAPPNMGSEYGDAFSAIYTDLAQTHDVVFYPFFLEGVAANSSLNLDDGMHPNADGVDIIVERILPSVEELIARIDEPA